MPNEQLKRLARSAALLWAGFALAASTPASQLGELPRPAISSFEIGDVAAEVCIRVLFAPNAIEAPLTKGYRLVALSENSSTWAVELVKQYPELADHARGSLCFIESGVNRVDGVAVYPGRPSRVLFLWADVAASPSAQADPRFRGTPVRRAQLLFVYDREGADQAAVLRATPGSEFGSITMRKEGDSWHVQVETRDGGLVGVVRPTGPRKRLDYPLPAYETLLLGGEARNHFTVVTFAGHYDQPAAAEWQAFGFGRWSRLAPLDGPQMRGGSIQDGWAARSALYRFQASNAIAEDAAIRVEVAQPGIDQ